MLQAIILSGSIILVALFLNLFPKNSTQGSSTIIVEEVAAISNQEQEQVSVDLPVRLIIQAIGVEAAIIPVGLTPDGAMDVPKGPDEVAWYSLGARPGERGSAVIAGHFGWFNNLPAVFDNLNKLSQGDRIAVEDKNGVTTTFVVREIRTYGKDDAALDVFIANDDKAHLNLITCTGVWSRTDKTFSERLVVFADKE